MKQLPLKWMGRRRALALLGGAGAGAILTGRDEVIAVVDAATCTPATPQVTEGPYWVDEKLFRSDIRTDPTNGTAREGIPLDLTVTLQNLDGESCTPLAGAYVDIWHCDAVGIYSDESSYNPGGGTGTVNTKGQKFLRGYQISDENGQVHFTTIYPGWYGGRTIHIHMRVRTYSGSTVLSDFVTQLFFDDSISDTVLAQAPYSNRTSSRDTTNTNDGIYRGASDAGRMMLTLSKTDTGYAASITVGATMKEAASTAPAISAGGIANAASGTAGVAPGAWISIYGSGLASATRTMTTADIVNGVMPTSLGGVSVEINSKGAFVYYVSPVQVNVLAPADSGTGSVSVTITNSAGTSSPASAVMQAILPGLFTASNYVRAVRPSDSVVINGTGAAESGYATVAAAKPGDALELYGTGFGPAANAVEAGVVFTGAYQASNEVTVTIGGTPAQVLWAGLVGPGLYQINVTVPVGIAAGDHAVVATVAGASTQSGALLKIATS